MQYTYINNEKCSNYNSLFGTDFLQMSHLFHMHNYDWLRYLKFWAAGSEKAHFERVKSLSFSLSLIFTNKLSAMKETAKRKTRSATRLEKPQRVKVLIKKEESTESANQLEFDAVPYLNPKVKVETHENDLKSQTSKVESAKDKKNVYRL